MAGLFLWTMHSVDVCVKEYGDAGKYLFYSSYSLGMMPTAYVNIFSAYDRMALDSILFIPQESDFSIHLHSSTEYLWYIFGPCNTSLPVPFG